MKQLWKQCIKQTCLVSILSEFFTVSSRTQQKNYFVSATISFQLIHRYLQNGGDLSDSTLRQLHTLTNPQFSSFKATALGQSKQLAYYLWNG